MITSRGAATFSAWALALLSLVAVFAGMHRVVLGDNARSRLATVYSLANHGTFHIDRPVGEEPNPFAHDMVDKVEVGGHYLSTKPPILPLLMTGEYLLLRTAFGWDLEVGGDLKPVLQVMTATLVGGAYALALVSFILLTGLFALTPWRRTALVFAFAFGTQVPGFATQLNNHVPATGMLLAAAYLGLAVMLGRVPPRPWRFALFGLCAAFTFAFDLPLTIFPAALGLALAVRYPRQTFTWGVLGALPVLLTHFGVMYAVTGSLLPIQMRPALYLFEGSYWRNPTGVDALYEPRLTYFFHMTIGRYGAFLLFPVLILALPGVLKAAIGRTPGKWAILGAAGAFAVLTAYYALRTNNYGGAAYGFRWYIGAMPVLLLMGAPVVAGARRPRHWCLLALLMAVSTWSAWECYRTPWGTGQEWTCRWLFGLGY